MLNQWVSTVPVAIHLDHGHYEDALECIELVTFQSCLTVHTFQLKKTLKLAKDVVEKAHAKGISVEAELVPIGGEEDGIIGEGELVQSKTTKAMVATGIDFLAAGIGNIHGPYPANWEGLDLGPLERN